jgi:hypothetical protein
VPSWPFVMRSSGPVADSVQRVSSAARSVFLRSDDRAVPALDVDEAFCLEKGDGAVDGASGDLVFGGELDHRGEGCPRGRLAGFDGRT